MTVKHALLRGLQLTGAFRLMEESRWRNERLLILCYHGISLEDEHEWWPSNFITGSFFETRLEMLRSGGYTVLPLEEALAKLYSQTLPRKSVAITFDDGLYNFYSMAYPLLKKFNYPSTLYLTTYYCDHQLPVFPLIGSYLFWKSRGKVMSANASLGFNRPIDLTITSVRLKAEADFRAYAKQNNLNAIQKNDLVKTLAEHLGLDFDRIAATRRFHLMTPKEVKELSTNGVDIQLHTHRHHTFMDHRLFQQEITENLDKIVEFTGKTPKHFCYPSGVYRPQNLPWLTEMAVSSATTCNHALVEAKTNPLLLPRFLDSSNVSPIEFQSWLTGIAAFVLRNMLNR